MLIEHITVVAAAVVHHHRRDNPAALTVKRAKIVIQASYRLSWSK
jgi:hypothetical protein